MNVVEVKVSDVEGGELQYPLNNSRCRPKTAECSRGRNQYDVGWVGGGGELWLK